MERDSQRGGQRDYVAAFGHCMGHCFVGVRLCVSEVVADDFQR